MSHSICVIGAASSSFGLATLASLLRTPELRGSELRLIDIRDEELALIARLGERLNREWGGEWKIRHSTNRRELLPGTDFVIISVAIDRNRRWKADYEIGLRHGITHYAENGGPGSFAHTTRNLRIIMPILRDVEALAPNAYVLNFTNPVPRITLAARRYTNLKTFGICHQINHGYLIAGYVLRDLVGVDAPENVGDLHTPGLRPLFREWIRKARAKIDIKAAGLNHFTWMLSVTEKETGRDLYDLFRERILRGNPEFEPLTRRLVEVFGTIPVAGDTHLSEYMPYTCNSVRGTWKRYGIWTFNFDRAIAGAGKNSDRIRAMADGTESIDHLRSSESERVEAVIAAIASNSNAYEDALNLPNRGNILNLPAEAIVETPAIVNSAGVHGLAMGALPEPVAELCRRELTVAGMMVDAAVLADRAKAIQAMALCPMVDDLNLAEKLVDDYIADNRAYFPEFS